MEHLLFNIAYLSYSLCTLLYLAYLVTKKEAFGRWAFGCLALALGLHIGSLVTGTLTARAEYLQKAQPGAALAYMPWSNWFETLSFFGAIIALLYFLIAWSTPIPILGAFIMPVCWGLLSVAFFSKQANQPLPAALQSPWMALHVPVVFTSYAILGIAFAVGIAYLLAEHQMKSKHPGALTYQLPALEDLDRLIYRLIAVAFPILTIGLGLGVLWAYKVWGRFWSWDPKETWALITWLVYLIYLHLRWVQGWRGRKTAYLSLAGFAFVLFTYVGVNYLSPLHGFLNGR